MTKTVATVVVPIAIGVAAALFNLMAVRSATSTVVLTAVKADVKANTVLTHDMLMPMTVRADKDMFRSAVRYEDRGAVVGRPANRPLIAKEIVLLADVRLSGTFDVRANMRAGERSLTLSVKTNRIVPGLRVGDDVEVVVTGSGGGDGDDPPDRKVTGRTLGPYRVVGLGERLDATSGAFRSDERQVVIAYTNSKDLSALEKAYRGEAGERVAGIEYAREKTSR